jgi:hypothetical protein
VQPLEVVAHSKHYAMLVALNHVNMHIGMPECGEFSWPVHIRQAWEKLQQLNIVLMVEFHSVSTLFSIREPSMKHSTQTTQSGEE